MAILTLRMRHFGGRKNLVACALLVLLVGAFPARAQAPPLEYQVKASYLYNFLQFITWPADVFVDDGGFNLCVVDAEHFGSALDAFREERVDDREIVIHRLDHPAQARAHRCHLLFIPAGAETNSIGVERGMLTVGETPGFLERGGMINLVETGGRIRFEINRTMAEKAGLTVSSRLLSLALRQS